MKFKTMLTGLSLLFSLQSFAGEDDFRAADVDDSSFYQIFTSSSQISSVKVPYSNSEPLAISISDVRYEKNDDRGYLVLLVSVKSEDKDFLYSNSFVSKIALNELDINWALNTFRLGYHIHSIEPQYSFKIRKDLDNSVINSSVRPYLVNRLNSMEFSVIKESNSFMNSLAKYYLRDVSGDLHIAIKP